MDIEYLLALQNFRESLPGFIEGVMGALTNAGGVATLAALSLIVYWCIDKRMGLFACMCFASGNFVGQMLKCLVCAYRPWIRDPRITPSELAKPGATGYSFPSGHTVSAGTVLGSFAWQLRRKRRGVAILCIVAMLLIAFSRNFLGVHTPQDVIVGLGLSAAIIALTQLFFSWIDKCDAMSPGHNKDILVSAIAVVASSASLLILSVKPYPMDFIDGELLVNPQIMLKDAFQSIGLFAGAAIGWVLERRFVGFGTEGLKPGQRVTNGAVALACTLIAYFAVESFCKLVLPYNFAKFFAMLALAIGALFLGPLAFESIRHRLR